MSKIHELLNEKSDDSLLDNETSLNQDEKQRILNMTMSKVASEKVKPFRKRKLLVAILVATMMIGTVAVANEYFESNLDSTFLNLLGIDKKDTALDGAGENVNKTVSNNGLDLTVKQTLGDNHTLYILIDINIPEDFGTIKFPNFNEYDISLNKTNSAGWSIEEIEDDNPKDSKYSFLISYNTSSNLNDNKITLDFKDFGYHSDEKDEFITLIEGNWKLSWDLNYKNISKNFRVNHFIRDNNYMSIITNISISPISISANLVGAQYDDFEITAITMKDGTLYSTIYTDPSEESLYSGSSSSSSLFKSYTSVDFIKTIRVDDIKSVTIGNEVINLDN